MSRFFIVGVQTRVTLSGHYAETFILSDREYIFGMLDKPLDKKKIIEAAKVYLKEFAGIDEEPIEIIVDPWHVFMKFNEPDPYKPVSFDFENEGIEVAMGPGKTEEVGYVDINHEQLLEWYDKFQFRS